MASFRKTYDTDSIVLRRIFAVNPETNGRISANTFLVTGANGLGSFQDAVSFLSTISVPTSIVGGSGISVINTNGVYTIATDGSTGIDTSHLTSTVKGLGSLGYLSTTQLASTIANLGQIYNSTILVAGTNITFSSNANQITINGQAGGGGGLTALDLTSTTRGLGSLGYISTPQLTSSLRGLGSLGYLSSTQLASTIANLGQIYNSTILVAGTNITFTSNANQIIINGQAGGGGGLTASDLTSTTKGLGLLGYLSTTQLASTIANLGQIYNSTILVAGTNITFTSNANQIIINGQAGGGAGDVTALNLTSTTKGLGSLGYLSSPSIFNSGTVYYLNWSQAGSTYPYKALQPTITGGGRQSDAETIGTNTDLLIQTFQTPIIHPSFIPAGIWDLNLFVQSDSSYLSVYYKIFKLNDGTSTQIGENSARVTIFPADGTTIVQVTLSITVPYTILDDGEGDTVYIQIRGVNSDLSLPHSLTVYYEEDTYSHVHTTFLQSVTELSTISGLGSLGYISTASLVSSVAGLGSLGYISSLGLQSTIEGLASFGYLSSFTTISSANLSSGSIYASFLSSQGITASSITANKFVGDGSLITNLPNSGVTSITAGTGIGVNTTTGSVTVSNTGVLSIGQGSGISITGSDGAFTIAATGGVAGTVATADLVSTVIGINIGTTTSLRSSITGLGTLQYISSSQLISSLRALGSIGYVSTTQLTSTSQGLTTYINTFIDSQELPSSITGLGTIGYRSSFNSISSLNISSGSIYASLLSSQQITVSSIRANKFVGDGSLLVNLPGSGSVTLPELVSSITGLGTLQYISSSQLISSLQALGSIGYISTAQLTSTSQGLTTYINTFIDSQELVSSITGLGTLQYISSSQLISSLQALGSIGYISTAQLTSTSQGLMTYINTFIDSQELVSSIEGLGTLQYISTSQLTSSIEGLGSIGYISTAQLISTSQGLTTYINTFIDSQELVSSIEGLGTLQYISTSQLTSSIEGLGSMRYISTVDTLSSLNISSGSLFTGIASTTETNAGRLNFGELYNNGTKLIDANGNILFTFQTL